MSLTPTPTRLREILATPPVLPDTLARRTRRPTLPYEDHQFPPFCSIIMSLNWANKRLKICAVLFLCLVIKTLRWFRLHCI